MKKETWVVIANSSIARVYKIVKLHDLEEIKILEHPESRLHNLDLVTDKPGRDFESFGVRRHAAEAKVMPKKQEFIVFAKVIADFLEEGRKQGEYNSLYIAANPSLLGLLRQALDQNTAKLLNGEIDKDMTQMPVHELKTHLPFLL